MSERGEVVPWFDPIAMSEPLVRQSDYLALREELAAANESLARLTGMKFSDRMHAALVSRAQSSEAELAALKARIAESKPAWVLGDELYFTEAAAIEAVKHWGPSAGIAERVRLLVEDA